MTDSKRRLGGMKEKRTFFRAPDSSHGAAPSSFEDRLIAHLGALYATALRLTQDRQRAEDLVQETSLKAWKHRDQVKHPHAVKGWLFKILMRTFINGYRKTNREPMVVDVELTEAMLEKAASGDAQQPAGPLDLLLDQCLTEELQAALDRLHPEIRSVVWLSDVEGFNYQEIAEMMGCPMGTVASRLFRGRTMLRELLHDDIRQRGIRCDQRGTS